ncbi:hypothetical protein LHK36_13850, partial [Staphylococcus argenteus]|nr:hypothetical protein [Staphylococcus argenteus]
KYMDDTKAAAKRIERKYMEKIRTGNYKHIKPSDIEDYMEELSDIMENMNFIMILHLRQL